MPERKQQQNGFFGGAAILASGIIIVKVIGAVYKIPIVNVLGAGYADFQNAYYIYALLLTISTAGLPVALSKMISAAHAVGQEQQVQKIFRVSMRVFFALGFCSFLVMFFGAEQLAALLNDPLAAKSIRALSPAVLCIGCVSSFRGYAQGHAHMAPTAVSQIIEALCKLFVGLGLAIWAVHAGKSADTAAAYAITGVTVGTVASLLYMAWQHFRSRTAPRTKERCAPTGAILKELLSIAIPITLTSATVQLINLIDSSLVQGRLQNALGMTLAESRSLFSAYSGVMNLYGLPAALIVSITASVIPAVSARMATGDTGGASLVVRSAYKVTALAVLPMGVGMSVLSEPIVRMLFRTLDPVLSGQLLSVLGFASIFVCLTTVSNSILQAYGRQRIPVFIMITGGIIKVITNYTLVGQPAINIHGAPMGSLCCFFLSAMIDLTLIRRLVPEAPRYWDIFLRPIAATAVMAVAAKGSYLLLHTFLGNTVSTVLAVGAAVVVYAVAVVALRCVSREDLALMPKGDKVARLLRIR